MLTSIGTFYTHSPFVQIRRTAFSNYNSMMQGYCYNTLSPSGIHYHSGNMYTMYISYNN